MSIGEGRERWGGRLPFIMAAVGSAVGLGNVWRFPAVAYRNGGGAFLIPYFVALITAGIPLLIVEYALGQKFQKGAPGALAAVNKRFRWVGWFALLVGSMISFYYVVIMAWAWDYSVASWDLKWTKPAPVRVQEELIPKNRVIGYLLYEDDAEKEKLGKLIAAEVVDKEAPLLLGEQEIEALEAKEARQPRDRRIFYSELDKKKPKTWTAPYAPGKTRVIPAERVVLYLKYDNAEHRRRLEQVVASQSSSEREVLLLSGAELAKRVAAEAAKPEPERKHYVSLDANANNYFNETCLGGFAPAEWKSACAVNQKSSLHVDLLREEKRALKKNADLSVAEKQQELAEINTRIAELRSDHVPYMTSSGMFRPSVRNTIWCALTWLAIFLIIFKGVRIVGKVVMWTVSLPVVLLAVLLIRGIMLNGATNGIIYYLTPTWDKLTDPTVWLAAYGQIFFSLSIGFGILIAYASYKPRDSEVTNNAFITSFANCATSFFAAFAVFSVLGYLAAVNNTEVAEVLGGGGMGLAFVTYPVAIAKLGGLWGPIIGITFFVCLLFLGIDSAFSIVEGVITGIRDRFPKVSKALITALFCTAGFCVSTFFATTSGLMWLDIVDNWMNKYGLAGVGLLECVAVAYFFRDREIEDFADERSEIKLGGWFELFIKYVTPAVLIFLLGAQFLRDMTEAYGGYDKIVPWSVNVAGWGVFVTMIAVALALGRNWTKFLWLAAAGVVFVLFFAWLRRADVAAMAAAGVVLLFGGFFTCLRIALKGGVVHGAGEGV